MTNNTLKRTAWMSLLGLVLPLAAAQAQYVRVGPPPPVVERHGPAPGRGYTWVPGYHRWDGRRYTWVGGRWAVPPRPGVFWVAGHWRQTPRGWHWDPGHWR